MDISGLNLQAQNVLGSHGRGREEAALEELRGGSGEELAKSFEKLIASMLVKEMRKPLTDGFFGEGPGADTFEAWFDEHVGTSLAESGALDLAGMIKSNIKAREEAAELAANDQGNDQGVGDGDGTGGTGAAPEPAAEDKGRMLR